MIHCADPKNNTSNLRFNGFVFVWLLMLCIGFAEPVLAQTAHPFATPEQRLSMPSPGWFAEFSGQMAAWQGHFYRQLTGAVRAWKQDGWAAWLLLALSFGYGVFHALGPGHGKAVLTAYVLANRETIRNGALLAMLSAFLQAFVAIALVAIAAGVLQVSGVEMNRATWWLELASYAMMAALGAWLVYKHVLKPLIHSIRAWLSAGQRPQTQHAHHTHGEHACSHDHGHAHHHQPWSKQYRCMQQPLLQGLQAPLPPHRLNQPAQLPPLLQLPCHERRPRWCHHNALQW